MICERAEALSRYPVWADSVGLSTACADAACASSERGNTPDPRTCGGSRVLVWSRKKRGYRRVSLGQIQAVTAGNIHFHIVHVRGKSGTVEAGRPSRAAARYGDGRDYQRSRR